MTSHKRHDVTRVMLVIDDVQKAAMCAPGVKLIYFSFLFSILPLNSLHLEQVY